MACKVLLSTTVGWVSTARHAAGFSLAGARVDVLAPKSAPVNGSRYISATYRYRPILAQASLRAAIGDSDPDLVVPCDDRAVENLLRLHASEPKESPVARLIERSLGKPDSYRQVMSRNESLAIARALGIRTPETYPVSSEDSLRQCLALIGLPAVLKIDGSWGGEGVAVVRTFDEAAAAFRRLASAPSRLRSLARACKRRDAHWLMHAVAPRGGIVSIQRFVPGRPSASAFACWQGKVMAAVYYDVTVADGVIGPPSVVKIVDCPEMAEATHRLAAHFGLSGLHGLDFIRDEHGAAHLIEINPRGTQGGTLAFGPGRDLAAGLCSCIMPDAQARPAIPSDTVVFFPREWLRDPASAHLRTGHHDVPWDDPAILRACLQNLPPIPKREAIPVAAMKTPKPALPNTAAAAGAPAGG
jgi:hypothetical protein